MLESIPGIGPRAEERGDFRPWYRSSRVLLLLLSPFSGRVVTTESVSMLGAGEGGRSSEEPLLGLSESVSE